MPAILNQGRTCAAAACALVPLVLICLFLSGGWVAAVEPDEVLKDKALEARARVISRKLRCLVCQTQSIDDSDAPLARDLRRLVRERLRRGDTDAQVIAFVHDRYGDFVLLRPPVRPGTWLLWFGPAAILVVALFAIAYRLRRRSAETQAPLSGAEQERVEKILGESGGDAAGDTRAADQ